jgi:hypothetical protein
VIGTLGVDRDVVIEAELAAAVVNTLLREDYAGLAGRVRATGAGMVLDWPGGPVLPLRPDGFLADFAGPAGGGAGRAGPAGAGPTGAGPAGLGPAGRGR